MTGYGIKIVGDDALPDDIEWMFVRTTAGETLLYLAQSSAGCARALAEAWAAYRCMTGQTERIPEQRRMSVSVD